MSSKEIVNLRNLSYAPLSNPLIDGATIKTRNKLIRTQSTHRELMDPETGEVTATAIIHTIEEKDEEHFVKVFADGVRASFGMSRTGHRVFQAVLHVYQREKMTGGYADSLTLFWFGNGLDGEALDMSEKTFQRGLKELIEKRFLYPRAPNQFWVNPALFFKGDRVAFLREYRLKSSPQAIENQGENEG